VGLQQSLFARRKDGAGGCLTLAEYVCIQVNNAVTTQLILQLDPEAVLRSS